VSIKSLFAPPPPEERVVELVVVHGMGMQKPAQTLVEWAEPLLRRVDWIARRHPIGVSPAAPFGEVPITLDSLQSRPLISAPDDPLARDSAGIFSGVTLSGSGAEVNARIPYLLDGEPRMLRLKITEAHWADSFLAMTRHEVFEWGASFATRALFRIGRYYTWMSWFGFLQHKVRRFLPLIITVPAVWIVLGVLALVLAVTLPFLGPIFLIPGVKSWLSPIMETLAEFVGDAAVWTRRPVRAAALRDVVRTRTAAARKRLDELKKSPAYKGDASLFVLAHSEGASITADMLFSNMTGEKPVTIDGLVTVGAGVTLLGPSSWTGAVIPDGSDNEDAYAGHPVNLIRAWAQNSPKTVWLNYWGIWDPVPSGPISTGERGRQERWKRSFQLDGDGGTYIGPAEHPVHNTASPFTDHQSYASNFIQVVDPVSRLLMGITSPEDPSPGQPERSQIRRRLHVRGIQAMGTQRLLIVASALLGFTVPTAFTNISAWLESIAAVVRDVIVRVDVTVRSLVTDWQWAEQPNGPKTPPEPNLFPDDSVFSIAWLNDPLRVGAMLIAFIVFALFTNTKLWNVYAVQITWNADSQMPLGFWQAGFAWRLLLAMLFAYVGGWVVYPELSPGWWTVPAVLVAAYAVWAPLRAPIPIAVPAARTEVAPT